MLLLAHVARVEVASAFARKARDGTITRVERTRLWRLFRAHWRDQYQVLAITEDTHAQAERLLFSYPLRSLDALHIACALVVTARLPEIEMEFWTADNQQARAARTEGLTVELVI
jgi:predicted nucleic acid-binding protein